MNFSSFQILIFISGEEHDVKLCTQNLVLPDIATLYGRLFLGALDAELDSISDESAHLLVAAVEVKFFHKFDIKN